MAIIDLYSSALTFAPKKSIIRNTFHNYIRDWILQEPNTDLEWNAVLQTLEEHSDAVNSVAFSADSNLLASASDDKTIKVWDAATGILQQTLEGHSDRVYSVAFSADSKLLASASDDKTIKFWDTATGILQQTLEGHSAGVRSVASRPTRSCWRRLPSRPTRTCWRRHRTIRRSRSGTQLRAYYSRRS
ncbi:hypothetical protein ACMFMG_011988 [Clarireedia jacksonii]